MLHKLSTRLWLTYMLLVSIVLCIVASGLGAFILTNPVADRQLAYRLQTIAEVIQKRERLVLNLSPEQLRQAIQRIYTNYEVRVIILDAKQQVVMDSHAGQAAKLPAWYDRQRLLLRLVRAVPQFIDANRQVWIYAKRALQNGYTLIVAAPRPGFNWSNLFREEILAPLVVAGCVSLFISIFLAIAISQWIATPLDALIASVKNNPVGSISPIQAQGPEEVRQLVKAFNEMQQKVRASQIAQRDFIANVSHDLKTPLTSIQGFAQAILDEAVKTPDQIKTAAIVILRETDRMYRMILDLLELARFDSGIITLDRNPVDLVHLLSNLIVRFKPLTEEKKIQIQESIQPLPTITGDADRLDRAIGNLLDNAIKFTPEGEMIRIVGQVEDRAVMIAIQDSGPGIPSESLERIFDRFYQVDKSRSPANRGTGLGLSIAREIIQAHGGEIRAYNNQSLPASLKQGPAKGATFLVRLPIPPTGDATLKSHGNK